MPSKYIHVIKVHHEGLNKSKIFKGPHKKIVKFEAAEQERLWEEEWRRKQEIEQERLEKIIATDKKRLEREKVVKTKEGRKKTTRIKKNN